MSKSERFPARLTPFLAGALLLLLALPLYAAPDGFWPLTRTSLQPISNQNQTSQTARMTGLVNEENGAPVRMLTTGSFAHVKGTVNEASLLNFIDREQDFFGISSNQLDILHSGRVMGKQYLTARQAVDGRPVLGTTVLLRVHANGQVGMVGADVERDQADRIWSGMVSQDQAAEALAAFAETELVSILTAEQVWMRDNGVIYPAWMLELEGGSSLERPFGLVSAQSGEIMGYYNNVQHADVNGTVTGPMYPIQMQETLEYPAFGFQNVTVGGQTVTTDSDGAFSVPGFDDEADVAVNMTLSGPWVTVQNDDQPSAAFDTTVVAPWDDVLGWRHQDHGRIDEFNMFYHTNFINQYYDVLDPGFTGMDWSVPAVVGVGDNYDNAYWNGSGMFFGTGTQFNNLALFSDVIYHEYTHGVTGFQYPGGVLPYIDQPGAMNEAWSDYFPCSIHNHSTLSPGINIGSPTAPLRDLNNNRRFDTNWVGEVHADGLIIGGALWRLRGLLNDTEYSDSLIHYAKYGFANTFEGFLLELLEADDDNGNIEDGTPHSDEIYQAFGHHGIGPGNEPNLIVTAVDILEATGDGMLVAGEMADINLTLLNDVYLYPPPAENITITLSAGEYIQWTSSEAVLESIGAGEEVQVPTTFTLQVLEDAPPHYDWITFTVIANNGEYVITDSVRVTVGTPDLLLVDDGGETSYLDRFAGALHSMGKTALERATITDQPTTELLNAYPYVIWFTGDQQNPISQAEEVQLVEYVEAGGNLILSGQYIGEQLTSRFSLINLLGVEFYLPDLDEYGGQGIEGEPASEGNLFVIVGGQGANNQNAIGGITVTDGTRPLYQYFRTQAYAASMREHENGGAAAYFTFGLEAVSGVSTTNTAGDLLESLLTAMGYHVDAPEVETGSVTPLTYDLAAPWPNPFNPETRVAFTLPNNGKVKLAVYNSLGREVMRAVDGTRSAGRYEVSLNLSSFGSGTYFIRLESSEGVRTVKAVLMK
ncbi:T9SS type A sorting domain-containing protein [bacterium]|nr:T9SS type A sorting domain-containing protein [bacterium]